MKKLIILGAGGFAREVAQYVKDINRIKPTYQLLGYIDEDKNKHGQVYEGVKVLGDFTNFVSNLNSNSNSTLYCICPIGNPQIKQKLVDKAKKLGLKFTNIIHPTAYVGDSVRLGKGIIIGPKCILTVNIDIGNHVSINPACGIGHDSYIGDYTTLYWNINISGNVHIGKAVEIGSKTFIKQGIDIADGAVIGAGAVVVKDVEKNNIVVGIPAKKIGMKEQC